MADSEELWEKIVKWKSGMEAKGLKYWENDAWLQQCK